MRQPLFCPTAHELGRGGTQPVSGQDFLWVTTLPMHTLCGSVKICHLCVCVCQIRQNPQVSRYGNFGSHWYSSGSGEILSGHCAIWGNCNQCLIRLVTSAFSPHPSNRLASDWISIVCTVLRSRYALFLLHFRCRHNVCESLWRMK